jgi:ABC-2 type transport system ATP-binding protein
MRVLGLDPQADRVAVLSQTGFVIEKMLLPTMNGNDLVRFNRDFFPRWSDALEIPMKVKFRKLSTGNRTKLCLLLTLCQGAELLILDEPTAGLDPIVTDQLLRILVDDFASEGRTLFLSSHHLSEIERISDWIGILDQGKLLLEARLDDIRANFRRIRIVGERFPVEALPPTTRSEILATHSSEGTTEFVLRANAETFIAYLRNHGATILDTTPMNLQEVFLEVVGKGKANVPVEVLA